jgi:hypothetical protein
VIREAGLMIVGTNDRRGSPFTEVSPPVVSSDGSTVAYAATIQPGKMAAVINDKQGQIYEGVGRPVIAAKSNMVAYRAIANRKAFIIYGGVKQDEFVEVSDPALSVDGGKLAYRANDREGYHLVIGKKKGDPYQEVEPPFITSGGRIVARARFYNCPAVIVDGNLSAGPKDSGWLWVGPITVSKNGSRVGFPIIVKRGGAREIWWEAP